jgi:BMFP domain-containing protein YqiC
MARRERRETEGRAMQSQNRFFDDLARVAAGAMGTLSGVRSEVETRFREQLERVLAGMDLVSRDEFEAVKAMAAKARSEQEDLQKRVGELESQLAALTARQAASNPTSSEPPPIRPESADS